MTRKFIQDISSSTIQVILNQLLGLTIFIIISRYLPKEVYGEFNWSIALLTFIISILSLRLEQIIVKKIAGGEDASKMLTLFATHVFISGVLFYAMLFAASFIFPGFFQTHDLLLILAISQLISFFASPFKQLANGKEHFRVLAIMSSVSNIIRALALLVIILTSVLTVRQVIIVYIISSLVELIICYALAYFKLHTSIVAKYGWRDYRLLIRESLPQAGVVILNASIARIDWILLGLLSTSFITAEYSFAYRVYELSPLPLLIIAPILLSRFARFFSNNGPEDLLQHQPEISMLIRFEMIAATIIPLLLNLVWAPLIDFLTNDKYGSGNELTFLLLSCCLPFLYLGNLLWSVHFAQNRLSLILRITAITFSIILLGDLLFIPRYGAVGAAAVYLLAMIVEYLNYLRFSFLRKIPTIWSSPLVCIASAFVSGTIAYLASNLPLMKIVIALPIYCLLLLATKQLRSSDIAYVIRLVRNRQVR